MEVALPMAGLCSHNANALTPRCIDLRTGIWAETLPPTPALVYPVAGRGRTRYPAINRWAIFDRPCREGKTKRCRGVRQIAGRSDSRGILPWLTPIRPSRAEMAGPRLDA
jgi:hypothetical protein